MVIKMVQYSVDAYGYIFCLTKCSGQLRALLEISPLALQDHLSNQRARLNRWNKQCQDKYLIQIIWIILEFCISYCSNEFWVMRESLFHINLFSYKWQANVLRILFWTKYKEKNNHPMQNACWEVKAELYYWKRI